MAGFIQGERRLTVGDKLRLINWGLVAVIVTIGMIGIALLYSAGGKNWDPWARDQLIRFIPGLALMIGLALVDVRVWLRYAWTFYAAVFLLLLVVEIMGHVGMGAQRWIKFGVLTIQPSELMKVALVLALARYFHGLTAEQTRKTLPLLAPVGLVLLPAGLVFLQPNLGTVLLLSLTGLAIFWAAGVRWWWFAGGFGAAGVGAPMAYRYLLHGYQRARVDTLFSPESDPLGKGYNILQSKIALGSGAFWGKGFGMGSQSQLMFLPEKHTDFIFVVLAEEAGMAGCLVLLALYMILLGYGLAIALSCRSQFSRLAAIGLTCTFFLYVAANVAMVTGLIPVVGIPLPLVSYGGSAMLTLLAGCGILLSLSVHREQRIGKGGFMD